MIKHFIEQETVDKVPKVSVSGFSEDENRYINEWIKYTLQYAKDFNDSNEVGIMLDKTDWNNYDIVLGGEKRVKYNTDKMQKWQDEGNDNLVLIHNHPSNHIFSDRDIFNFCRTQAVNTLIVVGNKGTVYLLQKLSGFDKYKLIQYYSDAVDKSKHILSRGRILELTLEMYQMECGIKYEKEDVIC